MLTCVLGTVRCLTRSQVTMRATLALKSEVSLNSRTSMVALSSTALSELLPLSYSWWYTPGRGREQKHRKMNDSQQHLGLTGDELGNTHRLCLYLILDKISHACPNIIKWTSERNSLLCFWHRALTSDLKRQYIIQIIQIIRH